MKISKRRKAIRKDLNKKLYKDVLNLFLSPEVSVKDYCKRKKMSRARIYNIREQIVSILLMDRKDIKIGLTE